MFIIYIYIPYMRICTFTNSLLEHHGFHNLQGNFDQTALAVQIAADSSEEVTQF